MTDIPTLQTERLILRPYGPQDFDAYAAFMGSEAAVHMDGPVDEDKAWTWFCNDIAAWPLFGFGCLALDLDGQFIGAVGLTYPPHFPEPECGWFLLDGHEGHGYATEAARALLDYTFETTDLETVVSYVGPGNTASAAVAMRLGGVRDVDAPRPRGDKCHVYRHIRPEEGPRQ